MFKKTLLCAAIGAGLMAATVTTASAYVVCNRDGDCWHTEARTRVPHVQFTYHNDDWYFHQKWDNTHHYRDYHPGRGYWRGGIWITL